MPRFRADFYVKGGLVFCSEIDQPVHLTNGPDCEIIIQNAAPDESDHVLRLNVQVIADSESIEDAPREFRTMLADELDLLCFAAHTPFFIERCHRVMDWEAHQECRNLHVIEEYDPFDPPNPRLDAKVIEAVKAISRARPAGYVQRALSAFRLGFLSEQQVDQFQQFWLSIETIAEGSKDPTRVPIPCRNCDGILKCDKCGHTPSRRPMAREAIRYLINKIVTDDPAQAYSNLDTVRNGLVHGRSVESIETEVGKSIGEIVNLAGTIAWCCLFSFIPKTDKQSDLTQSDGQYLNVKLVSRAHLQFSHDGATEHPSEDKIPNVTTELITRFDDQPERGQ